MFGGWEVQTVWNPQKNVWSVRRRILSQNMFIKWVKHGFAITNQSRKESLLNRKTLTSGKKIIPEAAASKEGHANILQGHEKIYDFWFPSSTCSYSYNHVENGFMHILLCLKC